MGAVIREPDGRTFPLGNEPVTIGRSRENRLNLANNQISSRHAEIQPAGGGRYQIIDLESRNGTTVNGIRLTPREPRPLSPDDTIGLGGSGGVELRFELTADAPAWGQDQFQFQPAPGGFGAPGPAAPGGLPFGGGIGQPAPGGPPADPFGGNFSPAFPPAAPAQGSFGAADAPGPAPFQFAQPGGPPQAPFGPPNQFGPPPDQFGGPPGGPPPFGAPPGAQPFGAPPGGPSFGAPPGFAPQPPGPGTFGPPQGGPGGYPPQQGFPGGPGGLPPSGIGPGPRKGGGMRTLLLLGGSLLIIVFIVVGLVFALNFTKGGGGSPTSTPKPGPTQTPKATIMNFYDNLKKQDYAAAAKLFTQDYIAMHDGPNGTAKVLQGFDDLRGKVTNYTIVSSNGSETSQTATVQVTRAKGQKFGPDQVQLTFEKSSNTWQLSAWTPGAGQ